MFCRAKRMRLACNSGSARQRSLRCLTGKRDEESLHPQKLEAGVSPQPVSPPVASAPSKRPVRDQQRLYSGLGLG